MSRLWTPRYERPGLGDDPAEDPAAQADLTLARRMGEVLERHYPGHPWMVHVESRHGMAYVTIPILLGNWKYALKLRDLFSDPMLRAVVKAGGEILERFQIPRSKIDVAAFMSAKRFAVNGYKQRPPV